MAGFGCFNPWPLEFGGGKRDVEIVHESLVDAYSPVLDMTSDTFAEIEAFAESCVLSGAWIAGKRLENQSVPSTMVEALPDWETIAGLRPASSDSDDDRRSELAGKFRGLFNNSEADISEACSEAMGPHFVNVHYVSESSAMTYWPVMSPGPSTQPWSSARQIVLVEVRKLALTNEAYTRKVGRLERMLDAMLPCWSALGVFRQDTLSGVAGFFLDYSMLDEVAL